MEKMFSTTSRNNVDSLEMGSSVTNNESGDLSESPSVLNPEDNKTPQSYFGMLRPPRPRSSDNLEDIDCMANLLDEINKKVMVQLRDGRTMFGHLRSVDQFANLLLTQTVERIYVDKQVGDVLRGVVMIRGDNLALVGEIDETKEPSHLKKVSSSEILVSQKKLMDEREKREKSRVEGFKQRGLHYIPHLRPNNSGDKTQFCLGEDQFN